MRERYEGERERKGESERASFRIALPHKNLDALDSSEERWGAGVEYHFQEI